VLKRSTNAWQSGTTGPYRPSQGSGVCTSRTVLPPRSEAGHGSGRRVGSPHDGPEAAQEEALRKLTLYLGG
jgi:hypothetical protein